MEYAIENLTKEGAAYIGEKINEIVPREVDADEEEFVLKVENENGEIIGGCIAEDLARQEGVPALYISTNHVGLYEKYGYEYLTRMTDIEGNPSRVCVKRVR